MAGSVCQGLFSLQLSGENLHRKNDLIRTKNSDYLNIGHQAVQVVVVVGQLPASKSEVVPLVPVHLRIQREIFKYFDKSCLRKIFCCLAEVKFTIDVDPPVILHWSVDN